MGADFLTDLRRALQDVAPDQAETVVRRLQHDWGGDTVYIRKETTSATKVHVVAVSLANGSSLRDAFAAAGMSRSSGYRLIRRR